MRVEHGQPLLLFDDKIISLKRRQFQSKEYSEADLQKMLHKYPTLLPVYEIGQEFAGLISLGREIDVGGVYVDNLFINSLGYLTIVETKLWRNPEAVREVVAQMLDYAFRISRWTFEDLDRAVRKVNQGKSIIELVSKYEKEWDSELQITFQDAVNRNLLLKRFLLMIVGDGIRENVEQMLDDLNKFPQSQFTFAMVEMEIYDAEGIANEHVRFIMPKLRVKTLEVIRGIVKVEVTEETPGVKVKTNVEEYTQTQRTQGRRTLDRQEFYDFLRPSIGDSGIEILDKLLTKCLDIGLVVNEKDSVVVVKVPGRTSKEFFSLIEWNKNGTANVSPYFEWKINDMSLPKDITERFFERMKPIFEGKLPQGFKIKGVQINDVLNKRNELLQKFRETIDDLKNELAKLDES